MDKKNAYSFQKHHMSYEKNGLFGILKQLSSRCSKPKKWKYIN